jgi:hypothetical protein
VAGALTTAQMSGQVTHSWMLAISAHKVKPAFQGYSTVVEHLLSMCEVSDLIRNNNNNNNNNNTHTHTHCFSELKRNNGILV